MHVCDIPGSNLPFLHLQIGRIAFKGCKTLNRIQTVVYPSAYHSNDNLLICAPTGAGKTNIAMLTVVHQIRQHIENDVIQRDKFKVSLAFIFSSVKYLTLNIDLKFICISVCYFIYIYFFIFCI